MSEQNIIPSAPPLYPSLGGDYRLKKISDCQKELENEISHYRKISKKVQASENDNQCIRGNNRKPGSRAVNSKFYDSILTGIGAIIGAPIAGVATLMGITSTAAGISSERLNARVTKHEKTVSLADSHHLSVSKLVSKAMIDGSISDVEFNLILREIDNYYSLKDQLRRKMKIENSSGEKVDVETLRQELKKKIQQKLGSLIDITA